VGVGDDLPPENALGYNGNWRYRYSGGELLMMGATGEPRHDGAQVIGSFRLLMMGATGEPSGYYPTDSNGLAV
jgi:hypothetical protein